MKKVFTLLMGIACTISAFSQAPEKMSYQAVVRNASGELVKSSPVGMRISILQGSTTGTPIYVETQTQATNLNGLVTLEIGGGTPVTGTIAGVDWSLGTYFIKTETDPTGGTSYSITGTSQILSVPYALYSKNAADKAYVDALKQQVENLMDFVNVQFPIPTNGLIAEWLFEDNLNDTKSTGTPYILGIVQGSTTYLSGKVGKALFLNGATKINNTNQDLVTIINNKNPWTISFWFKYKGGVIPYKMGAKHLISIDQSAYAEPYKRVWIAAGDYLTCQSENYNYGDNINLISINRIDDDKWYFGTVTQDGSSTRMYINNVLQDEKTSMNLGTEPLAAFVIGSCSQSDWATRDFFDGYIDQVRVYNRTLTKSELSILYNEGNSTNKIITDIEGNSYKTVRIGNQIWMAENLKTTKYRNGDAIPNISNWSTSGAWRYYNDDLQYNNSYGKFYNWQAVSESRNICPIGWHVPSDTDWQTVESYLGMATDELTVQYFRGISANVGGKLKKNDSSLWNNPNTGATNESGFSAVPGGRYNGDGTFIFIGLEGTFWSSTLATPNTNIAWIRTLNYQNSGILRGPLAGQMIGGGYSVRCIKD